MAPSTSDSPAGPGIDDGSGRASLARKVEFLSRLDAYPGAKGDVEAIETHMSWVFLVGDAAYKLKKPVRFPYLDFSTLAAREADCLAELRLNQALAPGVYLRMACVTLTPRGEWKIDGDGEIVDRLVVMRRLPSERMLDAQIAERDARARSGRAPGGRAGANSTGAPGGPR